MPPTLKLGSVDSGAMPSDRSELVRPYHDWTSKPTQFRGEADNVWRPLAAVAGTHVATLQNRLRATGFYPMGPIDGVFGYRTQSAVRLFQEYVRTIGGDAGIGKPDGIAGRNTHARLDDWIAAGVSADWTAGDAMQGDIFDGLNRIREHFRARPNEPSIAALTGFTGPTSSRQVADWRFDPADIHMIGIRRANTRIVEENGKYFRRNDDILVLLVNGVRIVLRGSTDPSPSMAKRSDAAFMIRGQHEYRFGWHKLSTVGRNPVRVYRAFKPRSTNGVLVVRAEKGQLTPASYANGASSNYTINIHWSGAGTSNWSAGCQVFAGKRYKNHKGDIIDMSGIASRSYGDLGRMTRGAYNMVVDLATIHAKDIRCESSDVIYYTLLYEDDLKVVPGSAGIDFKALVRDLS